MTWNLWNVIKEEAYSFTALYFRKASITVFSDYRKNCWKLQARNCPEILVFNEKEKKKREQKLDFWAYTAEYLPYADEENNMSR